MDDQQHYLGCSTKSEGKTSNIVDSICLGSGRFLRSVLIPSLNGGNLHPVVFQTRGRTFLDYCHNSTNTPNDDDDADTVAITYEVDTVNYDGSAETDSIPIYGVGTLGTALGKKAAIDLLQHQMTNIRVIGVGVTEAGLSSCDSQAMIDLTDILRTCYEGIIISKTLKCDNPNGRICLINTDNVSLNGDVIRGHVLEIAKRVQQLQQDEQQIQEEEGTISFVDFLEKGGGVAFHNTMVDRITAQREGSNGMVPRCEPVPSKALVIEDLDSDLPPLMSTDEMREKFGVVVRSQKNQLNADIALKLRVANGTHTAAAHTMALSSLPLTDCLSSSSSPGGSLIMQYLDALFSSQILAGAAEEYGSEETQAVYDDWRRRLCHPHFGLSSFFITQNGAAKGGIRLAPTLRSLAMQNKPINVTMAFAVAAILRFLTPSPCRVSRPTTHGVYRGWLDGANKESSSSDSDASATAYADGMRFNLKQGWYEFKTPCLVQTISRNNVARRKNDSLIALADALASFERPQQPTMYVDIIRAYLTCGEGGMMQDVSDDILDTFARAVAILYARMISGDACLEILQEMESKANGGIYQHDGLQTDCIALIDGDLTIDMMERDGEPSFLHYRPSSIPDCSQLMTIPTALRSIPSVVFSEVASALAIDLHTHLLPPSHGPLCLWSIDELLTYHYLVAEYFMTAPSNQTPSHFYSLSKHRQADLIWEALFVNRSPISEACRGVITTLTKLGLSGAVAARDLNAIRAFYKTFRDDGLMGIERFSDMVYNLAGVRYAVMTNIPFDSNEAQHWRPKKKEYPDQYKSALRVDPLLAGDRKSIEMALTLSGYDHTLEGARQYLRDWCDTIKPEYMMASTPHNFVLPDDENRDGTTTKGHLAGVNKTGMNEDAMNIPGAFVDATKSFSTAGSAAATGGLCNINDCDGDDDATASLINENSDFLTQVLMQVCEERDLPLALKIGAHRGVNPQLLSAGDGMVAFADTNVLARLCSKFPKVRFLATFLSRNNQHEACVLASKFRNLHIYGCWWYCNNPSIIADITTMRVEMLGTAFTAQHSDARVLDQLIYKWSHSRAVIANVLSKNYSKLCRSGWVINRAEIRRDVERLFGSSYEEFMQKSFA